MKTRLGLAVILGCLLATNWAARSWAGPVSTPEVGVKGPTNSGSAIVAIGSIVQQTILAGISNTDLAPNLGTTRSFPELPGLRETPAITKGVATYSPNTKVAAFLERARQAGLGDASAAHGQDQAVHRLEIVSELNRALEPFKAADIERMPLETLNHIAQRIWEDAGDTAALSRVAKAASPLDFTAHSGLLPPSRREASARHHVRDSIEVLAHSRETVGAGETKNLEEPDALMKYALSDNHKRLRSLVLFAIVGALLFLPTYLSARGINPFPVVFENTWMTLGVTAGVTLLNVLLDLGSQVLRPSLMDEHNKPDVEKWGPVKIVTMSAFAAVSEELIFRWALFGGSLSLLHEIVGLSNAVSFSAAAFLSSYIFSKLHDYGSLWARIPPSIVYAGIYFLTGTIWWPILAHFFYDLVAIVTIRVSLASAKRKAARKKSPA